MRVLMLCTVNPAVFATMTQEQIGAHLGSYFAFNQEAQAAGVLVAAEQAQQVPPFSVTVQGGETVVADGPLEPTAYMFGGLYVLNVADREAAAAWAAKVPVARDGVGYIEVFPLADAPTA
jgi:hypothetical protein